MATPETNQRNRYNHFPVKWGWKREFLKFIFSRTGETGHPEVSLTWWEAFYGWLDRSFRKFWHDRRRKQQWFKTHPSSKLIRRETESESWLRHHLAISGAWCGSMHFLPLVIGSLVVGLWLLGNLFISSPGWHLITTTISFPCTIILTSVTTLILVTHTLFTRTIWWSCHK